MGGRKLTDDQLTLILMLTANLRRSVDLIRLMMARPDQRPANSKQNDDLRDKRGVPHLWK